MIYTLIGLAFGSLRVTILLGFAHDSYWQVAAHSASWSTDQGGNRTLA